MYHINPHHKHHPSSHPHDDSLDEHPEEPQQYSLHPHHIELTFKKPQPYHPLTQQHHQEHSRNLFTSSERNIIQHLELPISNYFNLTIDQLSQLPFADLYSLQLSDKQQKKLVLVGDILQLKRVRMKAKMVRVNQSCLLAKQNLSYEQKNKLYLLDLLLRQLSKKQVVNTLHLNLKLKRFLSEYGHEEHENKQESLSNPQIRMHSGHKEQTKYNVSYEQQSREAEYQPSKDEDFDRSAIRDKIWIMSQTLSAIIMKTMFFGFNSVRNCSKKIQKGAVVKASSTSFQISPIKNISIRSQEMLWHEGYQSSAHLPSVKPKEEIQYIQQDQAKMEEDQQDEQVQEQNQFKGSETEVQLERLQDYIDQLIEECSQTNDIQKKYFIKWKIFLLQKIAMSIISKYRNQQSYEYSQNQVSHQQQLFNEQQQQKEKQLQHLSQSKSKNIKPQNVKSELSIIEGWSRATSQLSQAESNLKQQKNQLRLFLFKNRATQILSLLRKNKQQHEIEAIVDRVYERKTLMQVFSAMKAHYEDQRMLRELDGYYQQVAELQQDDTDLPFFFWKTTQLHKYFKIFKENTRNCQLDRILQRFIRRYSFSTILNYSRKQLRQDERINKWVLMREKTNLFRFFNAWKQDHKSNNCYSSKVKSYLAEKNKDMLRYYFSVLKLQFKKKLVSMHRADRYYYTVLKQKVFKQIKLLTEDVHVFRDKESVLTQHLYYRNAHSLINKFIDYYGQYTDYQRIIAKQQRLNKVLLDRTIAQSLRSWRAITLRKNAYLTIQQKLLRLNRKKKKREILKQWKNKMIQRRGLQMQRSDKHKQWLVKYYSDLCSVVTP